MKITPISENNTGFDGKVIVKNKISSNQNYLFKLHKDALENMIKDMPFDLFVEQSKSKKTISLYTNVEGANTYIVRKNKQDYEETAEFVIDDAKQKSKEYKMLVKINEMFDCTKYSLMNILLGKFKEARNYDKQLAKLAVEDFDAYKQIPKVNFTNTPLIIIKKAIVNGYKYRIYKAFSKKIPEEKLFKKMKRDYIKELKAENKQIKTVDIPFPNFSF